MTDDFITLTKAQRRRIIDDLARCGQADAVAARPVSDETKAARAALHRLLATHSTITVSDPCPLLKKDEINV